MPELLTGGMTEAAVEKSGNTPYPAHAAVASICEPIVWRTFRAWADWFVRWLCMESPAPRTILPDVVESMARSEAGVGESAIRAWQILQTTGTEPQVCRDGPVYDQRIPPSALAGWQVLGKLV